MIEKTRRKSIEFFEIAFLVSFEHIQQNIQPINPIFESKLCSLCR